MYGHGFTLEGPQVKSLNLLFSPNFPGNCYVPIFENLIQNGNVLRTGPVPSAFLLL